ncbi:hypothetical protein NL676_008570 [Syzygium grande]|nr:hypothetical protein NL676_008570 [Syzygium grande]
MNGSARLPPDDWWNFRCRMIAGAVASLEGHLKEQNSESWMEKLAEDHGGCSMKHQSCCKDVTPRCSGPRWLVACQQGSTRMLCRWAVNSIVVKVSIEHAGQIRTTRRCRSSGGRLARGAAEERV